MKKQTEILNYIRQKCLSGEKLSIREIAKQFGTSNRHLATAEELGYIQKVGPNLYKWKVGEVIPVMAKAMKEKIADYYKEHRYKKAIGDDYIAPTKECSADELARRFDSVGVYGNKSITTTAEEGAKKLLLKGDEVVSVTPEVELIIQDYNFWERMYNDLKARHELMVDDNKILLEITSRKESTIDDLRREIETLKTDLDFVKTLDDAGNTVIDGLKTDLNKLQADNNKLKLDINMYKSIDDANAKIISDMRAKIRQLEDKASSKRWTFTLFGLPIFGTYEK